MPNRPQRLSTDLPLLTLVGHFAVGKSTVASALHAATGCGVLEMGSIVRAHAVQAKRGALTHAADVLTSADPLQFARDALRQLPNVARPTVLVGVRTPDELRLIERNCRVVNIALIADPEIRLRRWQRRQSSTTRWASHTWQARNEIESSWGLDMLLEMADAQVDASRPVEVVLGNVISKWIELGEATE